ncbi:hypothetical protein [Campylobacter hyointestinalis]|nr:hypothetical protein [Campylobacter hyointestinalis]CUU71879.1 Uncharacterised protein [Campylobacter hyointestinalis subsp. hyointestinalis]
MQVKISAIKKENISIIDKKEHKAIKEKMKNVVLQNPKVKAVFERLKDK